MEDAGRRLAEVESAVETLKQQLEKVIVRKSDFVIAERIIHEHPIADWSENLEFDHVSGIGKCILIYVDLLVSARILNRATRI